MWKSMLVLLAACGASTSSPTPAPAPARPAPAPAQPAQAAPAPAPATQADPTVPGCGSFDVTVGEGDATLVGSVLDADGKGVVCASVELQTSENRVIRASTTRGGRFRIASYAYPSNRFYPVLRAVTADGRVSGSIAPAHRTDGPSIHILTVWPTGTITGVARGARKGDIVFLRYRITAGVFATIDADGSFHVDEAPIGEYLASVLRKDDNKEGPQIRVVVSEGKNATVSLRAR